MDSLRNIRHVSSPPASSNSPSMSTGFNNESKNSVVVGRSSSTFGL